MFVEVAGDDVSDRNYFGRLFFFNQFFILPIVSSGVPWIRLPKGSLSFMRSSGVKVYAIVIF